MKKQGCYNIDATAISEDNMYEDINDEFRKRGWRMTKNFQMGKGAWEDLGTFSADGGSGAGMCCGESLEEDAEGNLVEASAMDLVKAVKKPAKKHGITVRSGNTDMGANIAHFNKVSAPVDTAAVASDMGIGVGLAGGSAGNGGEAACCGESLEEDKKKKIQAMCGNTNAEANIAHFNHVLGNDAADSSSTDICGGEAAGDAGCCGGESLDQEKRNSLNEADDPQQMYDKDKIAKLSTAILKQFEARNWKPFKVVNPEDGLSIKIVPIGDNITSEEDCLGFKLFDVTNGDNKLIARNLDSIQRVAKNIVFYRRSAEGKQDSFDEFFNLRGVTFPSKDGQNRQENILKMHVGDKLKLVSSHGSGNVSDGTNQDSMEVRSEDGKLNLGMIPSEYASIVSNNYHRHLPYELVVTKIGKPFMINGKMANASMQVHLTFKPNISSEPQILNNSLDENFCYELFNGDESLGVSKCFFDKESCIEAAEAELNSCLDDGMTDCDNLRYEVKSCVEPVKDEEKFIESYNPELEKLCKELNSYLADNGCPEECWVDNNEIQCEITWGDWKHDHARFDYLVKEFLFDNGYEADLDQDVTEEDGSDTYSAIHIIKHIRKMDIEVVEEPKPIEIKGTLRENLERLDVASNNKYDLVQYYDALSMTMDKVKKQKLYDLLYGEDAAKAIYEILSKDFEEIV